MRALHPTAACAVPCCSLAAPQIVTIAQTCIIGLMLAWLYSGMDPSKSGSIQDETGILFFCTIFTAMGAMFGALTAFSMVRPWAWRSAGVGVISQAAPCPPGRRRTHAALPPFHKPGRSGAL